MERATGKSRSRLSLAPCRAEDPHVGEQAPAFAAARLAGGEVTVTIDSGTIDSGTFDTMPVAPLSRLAHVVGLLAARGRDAIPDVLDLVVVALDASRASCLDRCGDVIVSPHATRDSTHVPVPGARRPPAVPAFEVPLHAGDAVVGVLT